MSVIPSCDSLKGTCTTNCVPIHIAIYYTAHSLVRALCPVLHPHRQFVIGRTLSQLPVAAFRFTARRRFQRLSQVPDDCTVQSEWENKPVRGISLYRVAFLHHDQQQHNHRLVSRQCHPQSSFAAAMVRQRIIRTTRRGSTEYLSPAYRFSIDWFVYFINRNRIPLATSINNIEVAFQTNATAIN